MRKQVVAFLALAFVVMSIPIAAFAEGGKFIYNFKYLLNSNTYY
ncbi:hypothetical protein SAMN05444955_11364 [Lihuaxuella thermophila]|uniref:Uncharacterized protein n=1 Tax=Lihuaxuella thermophila TaxID=1173111 RepID=A0A1H8H789_9BACL|nr:hypothetical protein SAMN05444955_11364 [Lihuaxuella thermophila]